MAEILPRDLSAVPSVNPSSAIIVDDGNVVGKATPLQVVDAAIPLASQAEAEAGENNAKRMTPLRVKQAIDAQAPTKAEVNAKVATADLASTDEDKGAALVALPLLPGGGVPLSLATWIEAGAVDAVRFGVSASNNAATNTTALQAAIDYMTANEIDKLLLPKGEIALSGDIIVPPHANVTDYNRSVTIIGRGAGANGTFLHFSSGSLIVQASSHYLADFQVTSDDANGIEIKPTTGTVKYPARSMMQNISAYDCGESGITIEDCWIYVMVNVMARRNAKYGIEGKAGANFSTACNGWTIIGGELQGNGASVSGGASKSTGGGIYTGRCVQLVLQGVSIEGNVGDGIVVAEQLRGLSVLGCYFEKNGSSHLDRDIRNASPSATVLGPNSGYILNSNFTPQAANGTTQERAIDLYDFADLKIVNPQFFEEGSAGAYTAEPIRLRETQAGRCTGWIDGGFYLSSGYTQKLLKNECERFGFPRTQVFNQALTMPDAVTTSTPRLTVPVAETAGSRVSVLALARRSGGSTGDVRMQTTFRAGPIGTTWLTPSTTVTHSSSPAETVRTTNQSSKTEIRGTQVEIEVSRLGGDAADTMAADLILQAVEITTYEGVVSSRGVA